ncbi:hypothetical protein C8J57DRAFT_1544270 [Mycena rebaudengoi]|nr:hypothetical protein C8J57DRAFT_1544270 [Mycena rebaudengoi]
MLRPLLHSLISSVSDIPSDPTTTFEFDDLLAVSSSEAASLKGKKALTPIIAGSVIGGIMGIAYIVGFTIYFIKRSKRKKLKKLIAAGEASPKPVPEPKEKIVLLGHHKPGDVVIVDEKRRHHRTKSAPRVQQTEQAPDGSTSQLVRADTDPIRISDEVSVPKNV